MVNKEISLISLLKRSKPEFRHSVSTALTLIKSGILAMISTIAQAVGIHKGSANITTSVRRVLTLLMVFRLMPRLFRRGSLLKSKNKWPSDWSVCFLRPRRTPIVFSPMVTAMFSSRLAFLPVFFSWLISFYSIYHWPSPSWFFVLLVHSVTPGLLPVDYHGLNHRWPSPNRLLRSN